MRNNVKNGIFIIIMFHCLLSQAQNDSIIKLPYNHFNLKLSSSSSVIYPGISAGIEFPLIKSTSGSYFKNRSIAGNLNWYHQADFHDNLYLTVEWVMRRTRLGGFFSEFSFGPGFSRTFLAGTTYSVNDKGDISIIKHAGYNYALITFGGGIGYDFSMKRKVPLSIFSKMNILSMFPYNSTLYFRPVLELGIRYATGRTKGNNLKGPISKSNQK